MTLNEINLLLEGTGISVYEFLDNNPACEKYVNTTFCHNDFSIKTMVPYVYRRSGLFCETSEEVAKYLKSLKQYFTRDYIENWCRQESRLAAGESKKNKYLRILLNSKCNVLTPQDFPSVKNPQKLIQEIKDMGYVVSVLRGKIKNHIVQTRYWILPIPKTRCVTYEKMSKKFRQHVIDILGEIDVYEGKKGVGLLPDHKFSEIRWDENVPEENPVDMAPEKVRHKFQMMTTQRNQQKREVCRKCFKTDERGKIFGLNYYYEGTDKWDPNITKTGKEAERGCVGCPWYDIQKWREELQKKLNH